MQVDFNKFTPQLNNNRDTSRPEVAKKRNISPIFIVFLIVLVVSITVAVNFYVKARQLQYGQNLSSAETKKIIEEVSNLIILPKGEEPTVATVSDPEKIKNQPFFANAKIGDKVLIYLVARKAYLYRSSDKKLVEVAALTPGDTLSGDKR